MSKQSKKFSDSAFWAKLKLVGEKVAELALQLFFALKSPRCPVWAKAVIISALAYFIFPFDAVPDFVVGVGFVDDIGVMTAAVGTVAAHIDEAVKAQAKAKLLDWFGPDKK